MRRSRASYATVVQSRYADNTTGSITPEIEREDRQDLIDSVVFVEDDATVVTAEITISSAEILNLNSVPKELIAAPGAGKIIDVLSIQARLEYSSVAYTTHTSLFVSYNASGADLHSGAFSLAGGAFNYTSKLTLDANSNFNDATRVNTPLVAYAASGNPAAGNSTVKIFITYRIITV